MSQPELEQPEREKDTHTEGQGRVTIMSCGEKHPQKTRERHALGSNPAKTPFESGGGDRVGKRVNFTERKLHFHQAHHQGS